MYVLVVGLLSLCWLLVLLCAFDLCGLLDVVICLVGFYVVLGLGVHCVVGFLCLRFVVLIVLLLPGITFLVLVIWFGFVVVLFTFGLVFWVGLLLFTLVLHYLLFGFCWLVCIFVC